MPVAIEAILFSGDDDAIFELASDPDRCIIVDHREDESDLLGYVIDAIPEAGLAFSEDDSGEDLVLSYKGRSIPVGLTMTPQDRYITIRAINKVLAGDYEMRLFRLTYESDTHSFYIKPARWWREAEQAHREELSRVFRVVDDALDFS